MRRATTVLLNCLLGALAFPALTGCMSVPALSASGSSKNSRVVP